MSEENVKIVRETFERFQAGDAGWTDRLDPDIEWDISAHPLPDVPNRGRGRDDFLSKVLATYLSGWLDYRSEVKEVIDAGDDVVLVLHETARMRMSGATLERDLVQVWTVSGDRWVFFRVFSTKAQAIEALGLPKQPPRLSSGRPP
jgi:ketosteroid isomerase-like protein